MSGKSELSSVSLENSIVSFLFVCFFDYGLSKFGDLPVFSDTELFRRYAKNEFLSIGVMSKFYYLVFSN